jgi:hypothetical protein
MIKLLVYIVVNRLTKKQCTLGGIIPAIPPGSIIDDEFVGVLWTLGLVLKGFWLGPLDLLKGFPTSS